MGLVRALPLVRAGCLLVAQIAGGMAASSLVLVMFPTPLNVRTTLAGSTSLVQGIFIEAVLTAEHVFTIFMLAKEKHKATFIAPVGIGLALFIAELVGVFYTGGSLNRHDRLVPAWSQEYSTKSIGFIVCPASSSRVAKAKKSFQGWDHLQGHLSRLYSTNSSRCSSTKSPIKDKVPRERMQLPKKPELRRTVSRSAHY